MANVPLIKGISRVLQKWLKCFNGTTILTFVSSSAGAFAVILTLDLNDSESVKVTFDTSL